MLEMNETAVHNTFKKISEAQPLPFGCQAAFSPTDTFLPLLGGGAAWAQGAH